MAVKEFDLLCIGNAMVDVFVRGEEQAVLRHGLIRPVQHIEYEKLKEILDECNTAPPKETTSLTVISSGGGAANAAKIAALLGAKVCFTGAVGGDETEPDKFGQLFERDLAAAGVKLRLALRHLPTGVCLYFKAGEETRVAASPSAALEFSESDISGEDVQKAAVVVIDGFMLDRPGMVRRILRLASQCGTIAALDLSSVAIAREHAAEILDYIRRYSLILFMNEAEAAAFCEAVACHNIESLLDGKPFPVIVVKLGERGAVCYAGGTIHRSETQAVIPQDSTGAGDAFCAGFLTAWIRGKTLSECAALGNKAAGIILNVTGTKADREAFNSITEYLYL